MSSDPYQELGVPRDADTPTIKRAFRKKAKVLHPDAGGSNEKFLPLQRAYDILTDEERRRRYDTMGDSGEHDPKTEAVKNVVQLVKQVAAMTDIRRTNIVDASKEFIADQQKQARDQIKNLEDKILHWQEASRRIKAKGDNFLAAAFNAEVHHLQKSIQNMEWNMEVNRQMLKLLDKFSYQVDEAPVTIADLFGKGTLGKGKYTFKI